MTKAPQDFPDYDWSHPIYKIPAMVAMQVNSLETFDRERGQRGYRDMLYARALWSAREGGGRG